VSYTRRWTILFSLRAPSLPVIAGAVRRGTVVAAPATRVALKDIKIRPRASIGDGVAEPAVLTLGHFVALAPVVAAGTFRLNVLELTRRHLGALRFDIHCLRVSKPVRSEDTFHVRGSNSRAADARPMMEKKKMVVLVSCMLGECGIDS
jgi:hypothetical protein